MSDAPDPSTLEPFVLVGGKLDGEILIIGKCKHGDYPALDGIGGSYRLDEASGRYKWVPAE